MRSIKEGQNGWFQWSIDKLDIVTSNYSSELKNVDFTDNKEREKTRKDINAWVEQKTNDKIKDLLKKHTQLCDFFRFNYLYIYLYLVWQ